nr:MAG TPA: hypothetical protein [Caudoviricetes sp.]
MFCFRRVLDLRLLRDQTNVGLGLNRGRGSPDRGSATLLLLR